MMIALSGFILTPLQFNLLPLCLTRYAVTYLNDGYFDISVYGICKECADGFRKRVMPCGCGSNRPR